MRIGQIIGERTMDRKAEICLQKVIFQTEACNEKELFYRFAGDVVCHNHLLTMKKHAVISTDAYMNLFDVNTWRKYTGVKKCWLELTFCGRGWINIYLWNESGKKLCFRQELHSSQWTAASFDLEFGGERGIIYFEMTAEEDLMVKDASFFGRKDEKEVNQVHLSLLICTYKRKEYLEKILTVLKKTKFFDRDSDMYGKLSIRIIDNASEAPETKGTYIKIYHNPNTGGSGGFARGIIESRKEEKEYQISHVLFMDDDVLICEECFYRLYALLSLLDVEYREKVIAGRMFRLDKRNIQYTSSEVWNQGNIIHIGHNQDMTKKEALLFVNEDLGEYAGWWFACYPMSFAREHLPLPFFLHCDDVEYGLRHGGPPIVLNGIQVWHETYEYRISPVIVYYDIRNAMIVNTIYGKYKDMENVFQTWYLRLIQYHMDGDYPLKYAAIEAMWDYLKGERYFLRSRRNRRRKKLVFVNTGLLKYITALYRRAVYMRYKWAGEKAFLSYERIRYQGNGECK